MAKKSLLEVQKQFKDVFDPDIVAIAYSQCDGHEDRIVDEILRMQSESQNFTTVQMI